MKTILEKNGKCENFDVRIEPSDWRFSAAIVGLIEYFREIYGEDDDLYYIGDEYIEYDSKAISKENYLKFVEIKYGDKLHHKYIESRLQHEYTGENRSEFIKLINEKLSGNTVMKKVFKNIKFDGNNNEEILALIDRNRELLTLETFRYKQDMYRNYCNTNQLLNESQSYCRLVGYYIDAPKKGKSTGYAFNMNSFVGQDIQDFDFIPFAFIDDRESLFINDNYDINRLTTAKKILEKKIEDDIDKLQLENKRKGAKYSLFKAIIESSDFIDYDVEVIVKNRDKDYFETLYIRKQSIGILKEIKRKEIDYNALCFFYKIIDNYYRNIYREVMECILNNTLLDGIIDVLLKEGKNSYKVYQLININDLIRGENIMDVNMKKNIHACANEVRKNIPGNKLDSYRNKLTSSIIFRDYDRVSEILLQLSGYAGVYFGFADELFMDFEKNKDIAYMFVNALSKSKINNNKEENNNSNK
ncbi:MAG: type I CRISPR-associated protein Cas8a1/Csx8 [Peptostreptococcaceae bacterium]